MFYKNRVKIERDVDTGTSESGQPTTSIVTIIAEMKCDIQSVKQNIVFIEAGGAVTVEKLLICDLADVKVDDIVTDLDSNEVFKVVDAEKFGFIPHLEVRLKGGV